MFELKMAVRETRGGSPEERLRDAESQAECKAPLRRRSLVRALRECLYLAKRSADYRYESVFLVGDADGIHFLATDCGSLVKFTMPNKTGFAGSFAIPKLGASLLLDMVSVDSFESEVFFGVGGVQFAPEGQVLTFACGGRTASLWAEDKPFDMMKAFARVVSVELPNTMTLVPREWELAVDACAAYRQGHCAVDTRIAGQGVIIESTRDDSVSPSLSVPCESDAKLRVLLDAKRLKAALRAMGRLTQTQVRFGTKGDVLVFRSAHTGLKTAIDVTYAIMPMQR